MMVRVGLSERATLSKDYKEARKEPWSVYLGEELQSEERASAVSGWACSW